MMLYDVLPKMEDELAQIGRQSHPKWKTTLPKMFISEDKGASYLRFARFFLWIFELLNQSALEDKNWKNRFTALIWSHLKKFKYLVKIQGQHFENYEVFESF